MKVKMCPCGNGCMNLKALESEIVFKGVALTIPSEHYVCPCCGIESGTIEQAAAMQTLIADAYREKTGLLSSRDIKTRRSAAGLTQDQLACLAGVTVREVVGWETCLVQSRQVDKALRTILQEPGGYEVV